MTLIAGIDEAGYGPLLGPLVVSATAFRVDDPPSPDCLWRRLAPVVTKRPDRHNDSVVVGDSKRLYSRTIGLKHLETAALAFVAAMEKPVETRGAALAALSLKELPDAEACPWHEGPELALPVELDQRTLTYKAARLKGHLAARGVQFVGVRSVATSPHGFNARIRRYGNKARALFESVGALLKWVARCAAGSKFVAHVDKQGGRDHYADLLAEVFPGAVLSVLVEGRLVSRYLVKGRDLDGMIVFAMNSEDAQLPVALASMCSKYVRELDLILFNRFWQSRVPNLRPTAGYAEDGRRFLSQVWPAMQAEGLDPDVIVRIR